MKKNIALVLSSGGSRGLAQIGVINELESQGFNISSVSGASIGSVIGGLYAMGKLEEYSKWVCDFNKKEVWGFMDFTLKGNGLLKGERIFDRMKQFIPDMNIEDMPIPFTAVATDILNKKEVIFNHGSFYNAARASIAIPAVFTPVKENNTILIDGGILNPVPIKHIKRNSGDMLVVVNLYGDNELTPDIPEEENSSKGYLQGLKRNLSALMSSGDKHSVGYYSLLNRSSSAMLQRIAELSIENHKPDLLINIPHDSANTFDFHKAKELIELGRNLTKEAITHTIL